MTQPCWSGTRSPLPTGSILVDVHLQSHEKAGNHTVVGDRRGQLDDLARVELLTHRGESDVINFNALAHLLGEGQHSSLAHVEAPTPPPVRERLELIRADSLAQGQRLMVVP